MDEKILTRDLRLVLKCAKDAMKAFDFEVLDSSMLLYSIVTYFQEEKNREGDNKEIFDIFTKLCDGDIEKVVGEFTKKTEGLTFKNIVSSNSNPAYSTSIKFLKDKAHEIWEYRESFSRFSKSLGLSLNPMLADMFQKKNGNTGVDCIDALLVILSFPGRMGSTCEELIKILNEVGITAEKLTKIIAKNNAIDSKLRVDFSRGETSRHFISYPDTIAEFNKDIMGELKEKCLNWSCSASDDSLFGSLSNDDLFEKAGAEGKKLTGDGKNEESEISSGASYPTLEKFGKNMTSDTNADPVIGREKEVLQLIEVLCCKKKNSAILIGDPGCGKTAVVERLCEKIRNNEVPEYLKGKKIFSITTTDLQAGTMYRGQLEERLKNICDEVAKNSEIILYIDEFHQATGSGENSNNSIADYLKPALSRGEVTVIASTTTAEYKKFVEKDGALKRRFQKILIEEPTEEGTLDILKGICGRYEEYHGVKYSENILKACVNLAGKFIYDRKFPDKAIDLLDISGSYAKLGSEKNKEFLAQLEEIRAEKVAALCVSKDIKSAKKLREKEEKFITKNKLNNEVTMENVAMVVSGLTNIPVDKIINPEIAKLRDMKTNLETKVIGQEDAIKVVSTSLSKSYLGLRDENKPIASLLFVGPTGVGKTLLCEEIAKTIYGDSKALIRIDCGEYSQPHSVTKLIGAPASYVGYGDPGILDQVRERPNSLILFDEIEKMHEDIINTLFLNILSTGFIKMSNGVEVSFRNCIIVFTGNVGTKDLQLKGNGIGFGNLSEGEKKEMTTSTVMKAIKKQFRPEFINRLSNITIFNELQKTDMEKIFDIELTKLKERLEKNNFTLEVSDELKNKIIEEVDTKYGARDLARGITKRIEDEICEVLLNKSNAGKTVITADLKKDKTVIKFK